MLDKIDKLCAERDSAATKATGQGAWRPKVVRQIYFADDPDAPPFIKALAEVRRLAPREGWCYQHVQAISLAIDQYAAKAFCNRDYFLNKPYGVGGSRADNVP